MPRITAPGHREVRPILIAGYVTERTSGNIVHDSLDPERQNDYYSLAAASPREGTLTLVFSDANSAQNAFELHAKRLVYTVVDEGLPLAYMTYIVMGKFRLEQSETRKSWLVVVPYREVR